MLNRVGYCIIKKEDGKFYKLEGLNFKFNITRRAGALHSFADISIAGLNRDSITEYISFIAPFREYQKHKYISVYAGYEDKGGAVKIFEGDVTHAVPTQPPDVWLNIKARTGYYLQQTIATKSITDKMKFKDVCLNAANWCGCKLIWLVKEQKTEDLVIDQFQCRSSLGEVVAHQLEELAQGLVVVNMNKATGCIEVVDHDQPILEQTMKIISNDSGMIGIPQPTVNGVEVDIMFDPTIRRFQVIRVESELIPTLNGTYSVMCYTHSGELRGNDFKTHIEARRIDIYNHGKTDS